MNRLVLEWVCKAEGDFATAQRELRARKMPNYDAACFHAQQCAEKYVKAFLQFKDVRFGKTHNLISLLELLLPHDGASELVRPYFEDLSAFAVHIRYPGEAASRSDARDAVLKSSRIREHFRSILEIDHSNDQETQSQ